MFKSMPLTVSNGIQSFIGSHEHNSFYENDYLTIHPDLHSSDAASKANDAIKALQSLPDDEIKKIKILCDVGSGSGLVLNKVSDWFYQKAGRVHTLINVDISMSILNKIAINNSNNIMVQANAEDLPLNDDCADLVLLIDIIEHTQNPQAVIDEALRISKYCLIKTPIEKSFYTYLKGGSKRLQKMEQKFGHIQHFSLKDFQRLTGGREVIYEEFDIIPNRPTLVDQTQKLLLRLHLNWLYGYIFGGFKVCLLKK